MSNRSFRLKDRKNPLAGTKAERELALLEAGLPLKKPKASSKTSSIRGSKSSKASRSSGVSRNVPKPRVSANLSIIEVEEDDILPVDENLYLISKNVFFDAVALIDDEGDLSDSFDFKAFWED